MTLWQNSHQYSFSLSNCCGRISSRLNLLEESISRFNEIMKTSRPSVRFGDAQPGRCLAPPLGQTDLTSGVNAVLFQEATPLVTATNARSESEPVADRSKRLDYLRRFEA